MITFTVQGKPIAQPRPTAVRRGGAGIVMAVPKKHAIHAYKTVIKMEARQAMESRKLEMIDGPVEIKIIFAMPLPIHEQRINNPKRRSHHTKKPDIDNLVKGVFDALSGVCWHDDRQIVIANVRKYRCAQGESPHTRIEVKEADSMLGDFD